MLWLPFLIYIATGLILAFLAPVPPRDLEIQQVSTTGSEPPAQYTLSSAGLLTATVLLWIIVIPWAPLKRWVTHRAQLRCRRSALPSQAVEAVLNRLRDSSIQELTLEEMRELRSRVPWNQVQELIRRLDAAGITITGATTGGESPSRMSAAVAEKLDQPIKLTARSEGGHAFGRLQAREQVWKFTTSWTSWENRSGRAGYALVRDGLVMDVQVTAGN